MDGRGALNDELVAHLRRPGEPLRQRRSCRRVVRRQIDRGADVIKFATTGGVNSGTGLATRMFEDEARALVDTAHAYGRKVAVHAHGADGIKLALRAGADSIEHGTVMDDEIIQRDEAAGHLLRADPVDRERLSRAAGEGPQRLYRPRSGSRSTGGSASPASRWPRPIRRASRSPSAPTPASPSTAAMPTSSS